MDIGSSISHRQVVKGDGKRNLWAQLIQFSTNHDIPGENLYGDKISRIRDMLAPLEGRQPRTKIGLIKRVEKKTQKRKQMER